MTTLDALIAQRARLVASLRRSPGRGSVADAIKRQIAQLDGEIGKALEQMQREREEQVG